MKYILKQSIYPFIIFILLLGCQKDGDDSIKEIDNSQNQNSFVDSRDGNVYQTVQIGNQLWMAENLKYLPMVMGPDTGSRVEPFYYVHGYLGTSVSEAKSSDNYKIYGVLYNWPAAIVDTSINVSELPIGPQGICPEGWHLPTDGEWTELTDFLGGRYIAGGKLKASGIECWASPNVDATNETGFTGLPSGNRSSSGTFENLNINAFWWSSTSNGVLNSWFRNVYYNNGDVYRIDFFKDAGFCVRCIKD